MFMELNRAVDAPRRGPAAGIASRRDRWGKEGGMVNIYVMHCYFYSRNPPLFWSRRGITHGEAMRFWNRRGITHGEAMRFWGKLGAFYSTVL